MYKYLGRHYTSFTLFIYVLKGTPYGKKKNDATVSVAVGLFSRDESLD